MGVDISSGQLSEILIENKDIFHKEKDAILRAGLNVSSYINVDDTGARHDGKNGYCTHIGNEFFAYMGTVSGTELSPEQAALGFQTTDSQWRQRFMRTSTEERLKDLHVAEL